MADRSVGIGGEWARLPNGESVFVDSLGRGWVLDARGRLIAVRKPHLARAANASNQDPPVFMVLKAPLVEKILIWGIGATLVSSALVINAWHFAPYLVVGRLEQLVDVLSGLFLLVFGVSFPYLVLRTRTEARPGSLVVKARFRNYRVDTDQLISIQWKLKRNLGPKTWLPFVTDPRGTGFWMRRIEGGTSHNSVPLLNGQLQLAALEAVLESEYD